MKLSTLFIAFALFAPAVQAVEPDEMLKDPVLETRARDVSKALRCVVCQNETIDESDAELAHDMRLLVRKRIVAGDSNEQVIAYMVDRYGDFVLLKPRFTATTLVLWCGPAIVLLLGAFVLSRRLRAKSTPTAPLSAEETADLAALERDAPGVSRL